MLGMAEGQSWHYRKRSSLVAAKALKTTDGTAKGLDTQIGGILHHLLGYFSDIGEFNWKMGWTCDPDQRYRDGYVTAVSCRVCAQPEQMVVWASLVLVDAPSRSSSSCSVAVSERCTVISRLQSSQYCPSSTNIRFRYFSSAGANKPWHYQLFGLCV